MCGIMGHIRVNGSENSTKVCFEGLKTLQYRGYDSVGIAGFSEKRPLYFKSVGKVHHLADFKHELNLAIAHTRWATHGGLTHFNAHPQFDKSQSLFIVHNGIIENHAKLRKDLEKDGFEFISETDTEVIAHLISKKFKGSLLTATRDVINMLQGTFSIAVIHKDNPGHIVASKRGAPLILGKDRTTQDLLLASDVNAFTSNNLDIIYLDDDEVADLYQGKIVFINKFGAEVVKPIKQVPLVTSHLDKAGHDHYLLKEILEQPSILKKIIEERIDKDNHTAHFKELKISDSALISCDHIHIIACGSSFHAGCIAKQLLESHSGKQVTVEIASEFRYATPLITSQSLVIAISQSGETADTLAAIELAASKTDFLIAICNVESSTIARYVDSTILLHAGPEISVCSTKAFTSQLMMLYLLSLKIGRLQKITIQQGAQFIQSLKEMIIALELVVEERRKIENISKKAALYEHAFFIGRQQMFPTCLEAALKLKEISYIHALGIAAGELKHGTIALITKEALTIALCGNEKTLEKLHSNMAEITARSGPIFAFANKGMVEIEKVAKEVVYLPYAKDLFSPFIYTAATQLFAYYTAKERKCDIDQPRNLAKSVTVE